MGRIADLSVRVDAAGNRRREPGPGARPHGTFIAVNHQANGHVHMQFAAGPAPSLIVEASTNLVNWELIGVAVANGDGTFRSGASFNTGLLSIVA